MCVRGCLVRNANVIKARRSHKFNCRVGLSQLPKYIGLASRGNGYDKIVEVGNDRFIALMFHLKKRLVYFKEWSLVLSQT